MPTLWVLLDSINSIQGVIFQTPQTMSSKNAWLGVNFWEKISFLGCFSWSGEIAIRVSFQKPLVTYVYNSSIRVAPWA